MAGLLPNLRAYLVTEGVVRVPRVAPTPQAPDAPPLWLDPEKGAPAPGDMKGVEDGPLVVTALPGGGIPPERQLAERRIDIVDFWIRSHSSPEISEFEDALRAALIDKRAWNMADKFVIESLQWRPLQPFTRDEQGLIYITAYSFETFA